MTLVVTFVLTFGCDFWLELGIGIGDQNWGSKLGIGFGNRYWGLGLGIGMGVRLGIWIGN